ncbi:hypothetical protein C8J57DRAFT_1232068 [Mycena rebaudengoi]|nr:hypothetical protein C8J57DRAFT_1232068 [Mycena rebaudengoi]
MVQNFESILFLNHFYRRIQGTYSPLLLQLSKEMPKWEGNPILGEYFIRLLDSVEYLPDLDFDSQITLGTQYFNLKDLLEQARWYRALGMYFRWAKSDLAGALKYHQRAHSLAESTGYPTMVGQHALHSICGILIITGKPLSALEHAEKGHRYAEDIGDIYGQAYSLHKRAKCHMLLANYWQAQQLLQNSRDILMACGQQQSPLELDILGHQAEIHLLKTEYLESHKIQVASSSPTLYAAILASLNIALIETATGADSKIIHQNLDDWDDETALSLFNVALDGFTFMDVYRWRADCMVQIADILNSHGEVIKAVELWKTARPLFKWSSQMKDVAQIDTKLAEVDSAVLVEYDKQLQWLSELNVPGGAMEGTYIVEEGDKVVEGSEVRDEGRQRDLV